jgi:hypothetical protein
MHRKRRIGGTVTRDTSPHAMHYRACNSDKFDPAEDDALRAARGIINALVIGAALWALLALGVWALSMLWA